MWAAQRKNDGSVRSRAEKTVQYMPVGGAKGYMQVVAHRKTIKTFQAETGHKND